MTRTVDQAVAWGRSHATDPANGQSWNQKCGAFIYWCMGATNAYPTANAARVASGKLNTSRNLPLGAIAWFKFGTAGHVAFHVGGGQIAMASSYASNWGAYRGTMTIAQYEVRAGAKYLGYTMRFGPSSFATPAVVVASKPPVVVAKPVPAPPAGSSSKLAHGEILHAGQTLYAGNYKLSVQTDGNVVIYGWNGIQGEWNVNKNFAINLKASAKKVVPSTVYIAAQTDDHVVIYGNNVKGIRQTLYVFPWSRPPHNKGAFLQLYPDANLVIRAASGAILWHLK
jgi:hypothetical protein